MIKVKNNNNTFNYAQLNHKTFMVKEKTGKNKNKKGEPKGALQGIFFLG